jgi:hypothetical protein
MGRDEKLYSTGDIGSMPWELKRKNPVTLNVTGP